MHTPILSTHEVHTHNLHTHTHPCCLLIKHTLTHNLRNFSFWDGVCVCVFSILYIYNYVRFDSVQRNIDQSENKRCTGNMLGWVVHVFGKGVHSVLSFGMVGLGV